MSEVMTSIGTGAYVNEWRKVGMWQWAHKYSVLGTTIICYAAYETCTQGFDADGQYHSTHNSMTHHDGECLGDVVTREIPGNIDAIPVGEQRSNLVTAWYNANRAVAQWVVLAAFPEDF